MTVPDETHIYNVKILSMKNYEAIHKSVAEWGHGCFEALQ